jgi:hypothetical protein
LECRKGRSCSLGAARRRRASRGGSGKDRGAVSSRTRGGSREGGKARGERFACRRAKSKFARRAHNSLSPHSTSAARGCRSSLQHTEKPARALKALVARPAPPPNQSIFSPREECVGSTRPSRSRSSLSRPSASAWRSSPCSASRRRRSASTPLRLSRWCVVGRGNKKARLVYQPGPSLTPFPPLSTPLQAPIYAVMLFGCYALISIGWALLRFGDCPEAAADLVKVRGWHRNGMEGGRAPLWAEMYRSLRVFVCVFCGRISPAPIISHARRRWRRPRHLCASAASRHEGEGRVGGDDEGTAGEALRTLGRPRTSLGGASLGLGEEDEIVRGQHLSRRVCKSQRVPSPPTHPTPTPHMSLPHRSPPVHRFLACFSMSSRHVRCARSGCGTADAGPLGRGRFVPAPDAPRTSVSPPPPPPPPPPPFPAVEPPRACATIRPAAVEGAAWAPPAAPGAAPPLALAPVAVPPSFSPVPPPPCCCCRCCCCCCCSVSLMRSTISFRAENSCATSWFFTSTPPMRR